MRLKAGVVVLALLLTGHPASTHAMDFDSKLNLCATLSAIAQEMLAEMERSRVPMDRTAIWTQIGHDPAVVEFLKTAVLLRHEGKPIEAIGEALGQGCMDLL